MGNNEIINVIIPTYNRADYLKRSVRSVFKQFTHFKSFDLRIIDDASTDNTAAIIDILKAESPIPFYYEKLSKNRGVSFARNIGGQKSSGKYLSFLDSDDEWLPQKLQKQIDFFKKNPEIKICHTNEIWMRDGKQINQKKKHLKAQGKEAFAQSLDLCCISPSTVILERELFFEMGGFREDFIVCEDYDLWLKITSEYEVGFVDEFLIRKFGGHDDQLSKKFFAMDLWRMRSIFDLLMKKTILESKKQKLALLHFERLYKILDKGFRKHLRTSKLQEIETMKNQISNFLH